MNNSMRPFDLAKIDTEGVRKERRKRLLLWSLPVCVVVTIGLLWIVLLLTSNTLGRTAYTKGDYQQSANYFGWLRLVNGIEPYKMEYNYGTARLRVRDFVGSRQSLERALELHVPSSFECRVRVNLVLAIVGDADAKAANRKYDDAIVLYDDAKAVIDARDCGLKTQSAGASAETKQADKTLQEQRKSATARQNEAKQQRNGDTPSQPDSTSDAAAENAETPSDDQFRSLKSRQDTASQKMYQRRAQQRLYEQEDSNKSYSNRDYTAKNW
ncbi:MAG: hypothetical protein WBP12_00430 [Candidatus Saccharimonas sp.]